MQKAQQISLQNAHCKYGKASDTNLPTQIAPDVWILTTPPTAPANTMTLICPEKAMENHCTTETSTHTEVTYSLQCHFFQLLSAT